MPPAAMAGWEGIGEREVSRPWRWRDRREGVVPPLELAVQVREGVAGGTATGGCGTGGERIPPFELAG